MTYGLGVYVDDQEILFTKGVFNPVWCVKIYNISTGTTDISIPAGDGQLVYTLSQDRKVDQYIDMGGNRGAVDSINLGTDTASITSRQESYGYTEFYFTFYRRRV